MMFSSGKHNLRIGIIDPEDAPEGARLFYPGMRREYTFTEGLANPVNPILVAFRSTEGRLTDVAVAADYWMSALDSYDTFGGYVTWEHSGFRSIIDARNHERDHARRVLSRLARLT